MCVSSFHFIRANCDRVGERIVKLIRHRIIWPFKRRWKVIYERRVAAHILISTCSPAVWCDCHKCYPALPSAGERSQVLCGQSVMRIICKLKKKKLKSSHNETLSVSSADRTGFSAVPLSRWFSHEVTLLSPSKKKKKNYLAITVICLLSMLQSKTSRPPVQQLRPDIPISAQHDSPCTNTHTAAHTRCWKKKKKKRRRRWHSPGRPPNHQAGRGGRGWLQESAINIWHLCYFMCGICESDQRVKKKKKERKKEKKSMVLFSLFMQKCVCMAERERDGCGQFAVCLITAQVCCHLGR